METIQIAISSSSPARNLVASTTITPGMLITRNASGQVLPHDDQDGVGKSIFAIENSLMLKTIYDDYVAGDLVLARYARRGDLVLGTLAIGETVAIGDLLTSNGDGFLKKRPTTLTPGCIVGCAMQPITGGVDPIRLEVEIE